MAAALLGMTSCLGYVEPDVKVPDESIAVFSDGVKFEPGSGDYQTATVRFKATDRWYTQLPETTKAPSWLAVNPSSGLGGDVEMVIMAAPNTGNKARSATVTLICGDVVKSFTVTQAGVPVIPWITLDKTSVKLLEGESGTITADYGPENLVDFLDVRSSDESVVTFKIENRKSIVLTAVKEGTATITANYGSVKATCEVTVTKDVVEVTDITLDKTSLDLTEGESETLTATVKPDDATDPTVTWSSSDEAIATVIDGKVTAVKEGAATITAKAGDKTATCAVTVSKAVVEVTDISLDKTTLELEEGESDILSATVKPDDATDKTVRWSSSDEAIATVADGKVTAVKEGVATITAEAGGKKATCEVKVSKKVVPVTGITLNHRTLNLVEGETATLTAKVEPEDATDKTVTWSSSDEKIATVVDGVVTAVAEGSITVTAEAGGKTATCEVKVSKPVIEVTEIILDKTSLELNKGESETLTATVRPDDATYKDVTWRSSDEKIATVDENGKVTGVAAGDAEITATAGDMEATCYVTVKVPVESITLDKTSLTLMEGESATLVATVKPDDATDKTVTWSSSDEKIVTVDKTGKVTAVKEGEAVITAKAGDKTATCKVIVNNYVFTIDVWSVEASGDGDFVGISVTCSGEYSVGEISTWISQYAVNGNNHVFQIKRNPSSSGTRNGEITFIDAEGTVLTCQVTQGPHGPDSNNGNNEDIDDGEDINW